MTEIFNSLLSQENLLQAFDEKNFLEACKTFHDKLGDIDPFEIKKSCNDLYMSSTKIRKS